MFFIIWLLIFLIVYGGIRFDLLINPWIRDAGFSWVRLITTHHGLVMLYVQKPAIALLITGGIAFVFGLIITTLFRKS